MEGIRMVDEWPIIEKKIPSMDIVFRAGGGRLDDRGGGGGDGVDGGLAWPELKRSAASSASKIRLTPRGGADLPEGGRHAHGAGHHRLAPASASSRSAAILFDLLNRNLITTVGRGRRARRETGGRAEAPPPRPRLDRGRARGARWRWSGSACTPASRRSRVAGLAAAAAGSYDLLLGGVSQRAAASGWTARSWPTTSLHGRRCPARWRSWWARGSWTARTCKDPWARPYHYALTADGYLLSAVDDAGKNVPGHASSSGRCPSTSALGVRWSVVRLDPPAPRRLAGARGDRRATSTACTAGTRRWWRRRWRDGAGARRARPWSSPSTRTRRGCSTPDARAQRADDAGAEGGGAGRAGHRRVAVAALHARAGRAAPEEFAREVLRDSAGRACGGGGRQLPLRPGPRPATLALLRAAGPHGSGFDVVADAAGGARGGAPISSTRIREALERGRRGGGRAAAGPAATSWTGGSWRARAAAAPGHPHREPRGRERDRCPRRGVYACWCRDAGRRARRRGRRWSTSAAGRPSAAGHAPWRRTCSTSRATSTAGPCAWSSCERLREERAFPARRPRASRSGTTSGGPGGCWTKASRSRV